MKTKRREVLIVVCFLAMFVLAGCSPNYMQESTVTDANQLTTHYVEKIQGKLYFIPHEKGEADFPGKYKAFIDDHPELKVFDVEQVTNEENHNNRPLGYFVFTEDIK